MQKIFITILLLFLKMTCFGQSNFTFNAGEPLQGDYFSQISYLSLNEKIIVEVTIKEKDYKFILDTGAPTTISSDLFEVLNPNIIAKIPISDANNMQDSLSIISLDEIVIGEITFTNTPTLVAKQNMIFNCLEVDGFIGSNMLRNSILQIDSRAKKIIISNDEDNFILNPKESSDLFLDKQSGPVVSIFLKNKKKAKERLLFDTGMNGLYDISLNNFNIFHKSKIFEVLGESIGSNTFGFFGLAKDTLQYRLRLPEMEINGFKLKNVATQTTIDDNSRIGSKLLEYGLVTIDYKNKKFYFAPFYQKGIDIEEKRFPIDLLPRNNQISIGFIWDADLTSKLSVGDQVIAIDGVNYEDINICDLFINAPLLQGKDRITLSTRNSEGVIIKTVINRK